MHLINYIYHDQRWCTFFKASELFGKENVKLWPLFANFGYFPANLCFFGVLFADLNSVVMYQD